MDKLVHPLAGVLRYLAGFWLLGWTLYVVFWDERRLSSVDGTMTVLWALLIPPCLFFGLSWGLSHFSGPARARREE